MVHPHLRLSPLRLDAGLLEAGQVSSHVLELSNRGGGELSGVAESNSAAVTVVPARFQANATQVHVQINTVGMASGEYRMLIAVRTNGGDQVVPVSFMVRGDDLKRRAGWLRRRS
jgi:hypothetical protein